MEPALPGRTPYWPLEANDCEKRDWLEMKMKNVLSKTIGGLVLAATTVAAAPPTPADAGTLEADYVDFARSGVFDPQLSNAEAMELVSRGLFSGNPRLVRLTLEAMGAHAITRGAGEVVVERDFSVVPQIKEFLIAYWNTKLAEEGGVFPIEVDQEVVVRHVREAYDSGDSMFAVISSFTPDLSIIPNVLASNFPGDEDVHDLLWEFRPLVQAAPQSDGWMLKMFNAGRFSTPEVDRLRIDSLGSDDLMTFVEASEGLAISRPEGGIEALISTLRDTYGDIRERALAKAIVQYGPEAALPLLDDESIERIRKSSPIHVPW